MEKPKFYPGDLVQFETNYLSNYFGPNLVTSRVEYVVYNKETEKHYYNLSGFSCGFEEEDLTDAEKPKFYPVI